MLVADKCVGKAFEVLPLDQQQREIVMMQEGFEINDSEIQEFLDQIDCNKINQSQLVTSSRIKFNNVPVILSNFVALECTEIKGNNQRTYTGRIFKSIQDFENKNKRNLADNFSATKSEISGTGVIKFNAKTEVTITVTAKDLSGNDIKTGGNILFVNIWNTCTKKINFACIPDSGATKVLGNNISAQMIDNSDGTYTYKYQVLNSGTITIAILLYTQNGVYNEFFHNIVFDGNKEYNGTWQNINMTRAVQNIYLNVQNTLSANFYFRFKSPTTGTLTFSITVDNTVYMYIDGDKILGGDCGPCSSTFTGSISANLNQFYEVYLTYVNRKSDSELVMSWAYDSQSLTVVPSSALYYPAYISNSPFNVTVVCPDSYTQSALGCTISDSPCGNGVRDIGEQCDDHLVKNGNGCSSICMVEDGYVCTGGSSTTQDICTKLEFTFNSNQGSSTNSTSNSSPSSVSIPTSTSKSNIYTISGSNLWMGLAILIFVLACLIFDVILGVMVGKYPSGIYVNIEHIQLLVVLPIAGSYFTNNVNGLFRLMRFTLLGFDFVNIKALLSIDLNFSQSNETLEFLGFESESSFANILAFAFIGLSVMVIESVLYVTAKICCRSCRCYEKCTNMRTKCKDWMCLGYQIRYIMLGYIFILVSTISEINSSSSKYSWSWWLSFIIVLFLIIFLAVCFFNWFYSSNNECKPKLFDEFDKMLKNNINAKAFSLLFLLHRILFCVIILVVNQSNVQNKIIALMCIQYAYIILLILMRPYDSIKANINKIVCECSVLVVVVLMYVYCLSSQWRGSTESVFIYLITLSCLTPCLTTAVAMFVQVFRGKQQSKVTPKQQIVTFVQDKDGSKISNSQVSTSKMNEKIIQNKSIDKQNHLEMKRISQTSTPKSIDNLRYDQKLILQHYCSRFAFRAEMERDEQLDFDRNVGEQNRRSNLKF